MGCGAGVGVGEAAEAGDIARQFDDPLVVDVVQHRWKSRAGLRKRPCKCPWRQGFTVLYMDRNGGKTARPFRRRRPKRKLIRLPSCNMMGLRRPADQKPPRLPGDTPVPRTGRTEKTWTR